jgi:hypothetical protein
VVELDGGVELALEVQGEAEGRIGGCDARVDRKRSAVPCSMAGGGVSARAARAAGRA